MKVPLNRRAADYHFKRLLDVNDLDLIASSLLILSHSLHRSPSSQRNVQFGCVAVCMVDNDLWVASNYIKIRDEELNLLLNILKQDGFPFKGDIYIVTIPDQDEMHAEMKLVTQLTQEKKETEVSYIGVSKPCCEKCADVLDKFDIYYADCHDTSPKKWIAPIIY